MISTNVKGEQIRATDYWCHESKLPREKEPYVVIERDGEIVHVHIVSNTPKMKVVSAPWWHFLGRVVGLGRLAC